MSVFIGGKRHQQKDVADAFGISQQCVSRVCEKFKRRLYKSILQDPILAELAKDININVPRGTKEADQPRRIKGEPCCQRRVP